MTYLISFFLFVISNIYLTKSSEVISIELNYYESETPYNSYLVTNMKIGEPISNIYGYISSDIDLYSMIEAFKILNEKELSTYYNTDSSKTFKNISLIGKFVTSEKDIHAQEKFIFNLYNNRTKTYREIIVNNMDFILGVRLVKSSSYIPFMNIGFPIIKSGSIRDKFYFVSQLKEKNIIEGYDWFIYFENKKLNEYELFNLEDLYNMKPKLIIGGPPHYYKNDLFYKSQILTTYTDIGKWEISFKDVYLYLNEKTEGEKQKVSIFVEDVEIYLNSLVIYAPAYYTNIVKREFFSKYPDCHEEKGGEERTFYCQKTDDFTIRILQTFPSLYFQHIDLDYIFELSYKDLFVEKDGKYIFLVIENYEGENWLIGTPFLKKYQFVFNEDSKSIGFYNPNMPKEKEIDDGEDKNNSDTENNSDEVDPNDDDKHKSDISDETDDQIIHENNNEGMSTKTVVLIVVISGIVFISIGLILGKIIFKTLKKKKRLNELDEDEDEFNNYENVHNENIN